MSAGFKIVTLYNVIINILQCCQGYKLQCIRLHILLPRKNQRFDSLTFFGIHTCFSLRKYFAKPIQTGRFGRTKHVLTGTGQQPIRNRYRLTGVSTFRADKMTRHFASECCLCTVNQLMKSPAVLKITSI
jgi:hypothetical protein